MQVSKVVYYFSCHPSLPHPHNSDLSPPNLSRSGSSETLGDARLVPESFPEIHGKVKAARKGVLNLGHNPDCRGNSWGRGGVRLDLDLEFRSTSLGCHIGVGRILKVKFQK